MKNQDKAHRALISCRAFLSERHLPLNARYLLFQLVRVYGLGCPDEVVAGGIQRLAKDTGFSKDGVTSILNLLVEKGLLVQGQEPTGGRYMTTYTLAEGFEKSLLRPQKCTYAVPWVAKILKADEEPFSRLSISERSVLAFLWGQVKNSRTCAIDGESVNNLARRAGVDQSTVTLRIKQLHQKGMLVSSLAAFTADGVANKTKTYFLLGPEIVACWPNAFTWYVAMDGVLEWLAGADTDFSSEDLVRKIESGAGYVTAHLDVVRNDLPSCWKSSSDRYYVLMQCCAAISHAFSVENGDFWGARILLSKIQYALIKMFGLPMIGNNSYGAVIEENVDLSISDSSISDLNILEKRTCALFSFAEEVSVLLVQKLRRLFPVLFQTKDLGWGMKLLSCYPVEREGVSFMRIDCVAEDEAAWSKFGAFLLIENDRKDQVLPEQLKEKAKI